MGGALAIAQPGDLGQDTAAPAQGTTTSTTASSTTSTTAAPTTTAGPTTTAAPAATTTLPGGSPTTTAGSGLGVGGTASGGSDGIADTGGESMIGAGMALGALGLLLRRAAASPR